MKIKKGFEKLTVDGECVIIPVDDGNGEKQKVFTLNETAALVIESYGEGKTDAEIVKILTDTYNVTKEQAEADLTELKKQIKVAGCFETEGAF